MSGQGGVCCKECGAQVALLVFAEPLRVGGAQVLVGGRSVRVDQLRAVTALLG